MILVLFTLYVFVFCTLLTDNESPSISGVNHITAVITQSINLTYNASDDSNDISYNIVHFPADGFATVYTGDQLTMTWTPEDLNPQRIV